MHAFCECQHIHPIKPLKNMTYLQPEWTELCWGKLRCKPFSSVLHGVLHRSWLEVSCDWAWVDKCYFQALSFPWSLQGTKLYTDNGEHAAYHQLLCKCSSIKHTTNTFTLSGFVFDVASVKWSLCKVLLWSPASALYVLVCEWSLVLVLCSISGVEISWWLIN